MSSAVEEMSERHIRGCMLLSLKSFPLIYDILHACISLTSALSNVQLFGNELRSVAGVFVVISTMSGTIVMNLVSLILSDSRQ